MEAAIALMRAFINDEYQATIHSASDTDYDEFVEQVRQLDSHFRRSAGVSSGIHRPRRVPPALKRELEHRAKHAAFRKIFYLVEYESPDYGSLFQVVVGGPDDETNGDFQERFLIANMGKGLQIVNRQRVCDVCESAGTYREEVCPECDGDGWLHRAGVRFEELGDRVSKYVEDKPTKAAQVALWNRMK